MGIEDVLVRKRILSPVAGVTCSNRFSLSSESQSGINSWMAVGSMTAPDRICAPISPAFSRSMTRNSSLPASFANCFSRMAALSPAGPREVRTDQRTHIETYLHPQCRHRLGPILARHSLDQSCHQHPQIFGAYLLKLHANFRSTEAVSLDDVELLDQVEDIAKL